MQKLTELGVDRIVPFRPRSVVRWTSQAAATWAAQGGAEVPPCRATVRGCRGDRLADHHGRRPAWRRAGRPRRQPRRASSTGRARRPRGRLGEPPSGAEAGARPAVGAHVLRAETAALMAGVLLTASRWGRLGRLVLKIRNSRRVLGPDHGSRVQMASGKPAGHVVGGGPRGGASWEERRTMSANDDGDVTGAYAGKVGHPSASHPPPEAAVAAGRGGRLRTRSSRRPCSAPTSGASGPSRCRGCSAWRASTASRSTSCSPVTTAPTSGPARATATSSSTSPRAGP